MGVRDVATQWNDMLARVLQLVHELEPAKIHSFVDATGFPGNAFRGEETPGHSMIAKGVYARTASSTSAKIDLLKGVFAACGIDPGELVFEMFLENKEQRQV